MNQELISVISAFFGSLGFSIIYNIRGLRIWIPAIGGAVFWAVYLIFLHFINNEFLGFFFVAILITIYSEIWARILKTFHRYFNAHSYSTDPRRITILCNGCRSPA